MKATSQSRWLKKAIQYIIVTAAVLFSLLVGVWGASPFILRYALSRYLAPQNIKITPDSHLRFNPFRTQVTVRKLELRKEERLVIGVDSAAVHIRPVELLSAKLHLTAVSLSGFYLDVHPMEDYLEIGGFRISKSDGKETKSRPIPITLRVDRFRLDDSQIHLRTANKNHLFGIGHFSLNHLNLNLDHKQLVARVDSEVLGGLVSMHIDLDLNKQNQGMIGAMARIKDLDLTRLRPYFPSGGLNVSGQVSASANVEFSLKTDAVSMLVSETQLMTKALRLGNKRFDLIGGNQRLDLENLLINFGGDATHKTSDDTTKSAEKGPRGSRISSIAGQSDRSDADSPSLISLVTSRISDGKQFLDIPFSAVLSRLTLRNTDARLRTYKLDEVIHVDSFAIHDLKMGPDHLDLTTQLHARAAGMELNLGSEVALSGLNNGNVTTKLDVHQADLRALKPYLPHSIDTLAGQLGLTSKIELKINNDRISLFAPEMVLKPKNIHIGNQAVELLTGDNNVVIQGISIDILKNAPVANSKNPLPFTAVLSDISLEKTKARIKLKDMDEAIQIDSFGIQDLVINQDSLRLTTRLSAHSSGAELKIGSEFGFSGLNEGHVSSTVDLKNLNLWVLRPYLPRSIEAITGNLGVSCQIDLDFDNDNIRLSSPELRFKPVEVLVAHQGVEFLAHRTALKVQGVSLDFQSRKSGEDGYGKNTRPPRSDGGKSARARNAKNTDKPRFSIVELVRQLRNQVSDDMNTGSPIPYALELSRLNLLDSQFFIRNKKNAETVLINAIDVRDMRVSPNERNASIDFRVNAFGSSVNVESSFKLNATLDGSIFARLGSNHIPLDQIQDYFPDSLGVIEGDVKLVGAVNIDLAGSEMKFNIENTLMNTGDLRISNDHFEMVGGNQTVLLNQLQFIARKPESEFQLQSLDTDILSQQPAPIGTQVYDGAKNIPYEYHLRIPHIEIYNLKIQPRTGVFREPIFVDSVDLNNVSVADGLASLNLNIKLKTLGGGVRLSSRLETNGLQRGEGNVEFDAEEISLTALQRYLPDGFGLLGGRLSTDGYFDFQLDKQKWKVNSADLRLSLSRSAIKNQYIHLDGGIQRVALKDVRVSANGKKNPTITMNGRFESTEADLRGVYKLNRKYHWKNLDIDNIHFTYPVPKGSSLIDLENIKINKIEETADVEIFDRSQPVAKADLLTVDNLSIGRDHVLLGQFELSGLDGNLVVTKAGKFKNLVWIDKAEDRGNNSSRVAKSERPSVHFKIDQLRILNSKKIILRNEKMTPADTREIRLDQFTMTELDNWSTGPSQFTMIGKMDQYALFDLTGQSKPYDGKFDLRLNGKLKEVSLPSLKNYLNNTIVSDIKAGQLDADFNITVANAKIEGKADLHLRGLHLEAEKNSVWDQLWQNTDYSLNTMLWLLSDDQDNVKLTVPLSGRIDDPNFSLNGILNVAIEKAISTGVKTALIGTLIPNAQLLTISVSVGKKLFRIRFDDLIYPFGVIKVEPSNNAYAQNFIKLLKENPKIQVRVCGIAVPNDLSLAQRDQVDEKELSKRLQMISQNRSEEFKKYCITEGKIESSRLLVCRPQIDFTSGAKPRIEFDF